MDEKLEAQREQARALGYTDEEIDAYLKRKNEPETPIETPVEKPATPGMFRTPAIGGGANLNAPVSPWVDRTEEAKALFDLGAAKTALTVGTGYGVYQAGKNIAEAFRPPAGSVSAGSTPTTFTGGANPAFDQALSKAYTPPSGTPSASPTMTPKTIPSAVLGSAVPAAAFSMPYAMAAYEQSKIRQNPNAPHYADNPYAMVQRGEMPTQGAAGKMNQRIALNNQQYGGLTQLQQDELEQDRLDRAIRYKAAKKVLGQP